ncbi:MAG: hypothetical protein NZ524_10840, partial [Thiobacillaceae bacterium]|nr:hypothetical protein [Thiobacillaceae bacterium]
AYYYLKVKQLLEGNRPGWPVPSPEAYVHIVQEIERDFLAAVQKNIRLRLFSNPWKNLRMAAEDYSRTDRLAELLDEHFFAPIVGKTGLKLREIHIQPGLTLLSQTRTDRDVRLSELMASSSFDIDLYNAHAEYKIPILVINATCLNTGHPWHFTGAYVGEPPPRREFEREVDTNVRLPQLRFDGTYHADRKLPAGERRRLSDRQRSKLACLTLADAVAASAAVPGIFPPLAIHDLYTNSRGEEIVVQLTDGGVFDNQGMDALFQHRCTHMIVSDASGQLEDERILGTRLPQVVQRASNVMMDKIRTETLYRLHAGCDLHAALRQSGCVVHACTLDENDLNAYALIHLRQNFGNSAQHPAFPGPVDRPEGTIYRLSNLRTDLDAFSDAEAYALMYHAYRLLHDRLQAPAFAALCAPPPQQPRWRFHAIVPRLRDSRELAWLHRRLKIGKHLFFRAFRLRPVLSWAIALPLLGAFLGIFWWSLCHTLAEPGARTRSYGLCAPDALVLLTGHITVQDLLPYLLVALAVPLFGMGAVQEWIKRLGWVRWLRPKGPNQIMGLALTIVLTLTAGALWIYRQVFDRIFLCDGRIDSDRICGPCEALARLAGCFTKARRTPRAGLPDGASSAARTDSGG